MCYPAAGELAQVLSGEEGLRQLLGSYPGKGGFSESQLLLVVQHRGSLGQPGDTEFQYLFCYTPYVLFGCQQESNKEADDKEY